MTARLQQPAAQSGAGAPAATVQEVTVHVLLLCQYPLGVSPGQRFRFEQYLDDLRAAGVVVDVQPFSLRPPGFFHQPGRHLAKVLELARCFLRRLFLARQFRRYDRIVIPREAAPLGPPLIEWLALRSGVPVVFDLDDAVFIADVSPANRRLRWLKFPGRARLLARGAEGVAVCNQHLAKWALQYNPNVILVPTSVELRHHRTSRDRAASTGPAVIGWTGSETTLRFLEMIRPALLALQQVADFELNVICDRDPGFPELAHYRFTAWHLETEIADLDRFDVGLMPVPETAWALGKVGFKAIQYGAMEIPSVVSSTGSGGEVVEHGVTGLVVANTTQAWLDAMHFLLANPTAAVQMGRAARARIARIYSTDAQRGNYLRMYKGVR